MDGGGGFIPATILCKSCQEIMTDHLPVRSAKRIFSLRLFFKNGYLAHQPSSTWCLDPTIAHVERGWLLPARMASFASAKGQIKTSCTTSGQEAMPTEAWNPPLPVPGAIGKLCTTPVPH